MPALRFTGNYPSRQGDTQQERQRYQCKDCQKRFDDLTGTVFEVHHQPLKVWVLCLYLMPLNLSNQQIARELGLNKNDMQAMTEQLRRGVEKKTPVNLSGNVEFDEVYVKAGHKAPPEACADAEREGRPPRPEKCTGRGDTPMSG